MLSRGEEGHLMLPMRTNTPDHFIRGLPTRGWAGLLCWAYLVASITFLASHCIAHEFGGNGTLQPQRNTDDNGQMVQNVRNHLSV